MLQVLPAVAVDESGLGLGGDGIGSAPVVHLTILLQGVEFIFQLRLAQVL